MQTAWAFSLPIGGGFRVSIYLAVGAVAPLPSSAAPSSAAQGVTPRFINSWIWKPQSMIKDWIPPHPDVGSRPALQTSGPAGARHSSVSAGVIACSQVDAPSKR